MQLRARLADEPGDGAVRSVESKLSRRRLPAAHGFLPASRHACAIVGMQRGDPAITECLFWREAGDLAPTSIDEARAPLRIRAENPDRRNIREHAKTLLTVAQRRFGATTFGDVAKAPHAPFRQIADQLGPREALEHAPVLAVQYVELLLFRSQIDIADTHQEQL